jgi:FkbH-like protein
MLGQIDHNAREFVIALKSAAARGGSPCLVCFCPPSSSLQAHPATGARLRAVEETLLQELKSIGSVYLSCTDELRRLYPVTDYYDASGDELGHVPYTPTFFTALATLVARKVHCLFRRGHKVIVLDLDQTIWSGVCGEDGAMGIRIDGPRLALQNFMRAQHEAGMVLCVCSKNNEDDVNEVFRKRVEMPLRREHFIGWRANWISKSENIRSLAKELNLGLDAFIFVDDNPVECAEVEANCPEVLTLLLPEQPEEIEKFLNHCWVFDHLKITAEDSKRAEMYRQNQEREKLRSEASGLGDFIASLNLRINIEPLTAANYPRASQLTQRTNQFNFTTIRRSEGELQQFLSHGEGLVVTVNDRFGDYGLVGLVLFAVDERTLNIDTFLLSCRVLGRGVEHRMLSRLGEIARERRLDWVAAAFADSGKNRPAAVFLESIGSAYRQTSSDKLVYRFPAGYAQEVALNTQGADQEIPAAIVENSLKGTSEKFAAVDRKFTRCRNIAVELSDPQKIQQRVEAGRKVRIDRVSQYEAPVTEIENKLCEIWKKLLHVEKVGVADNFFELGGHSLLAVRLFALIEKEVGRKFPLVTLFQAPTVRQLAGVISASNEKGSQSLLVPIQPAGNRPPLFLVHGAGGDVLWGYANLAKHLGQDQPIYGIKSLGQLGKEEPASLEEMATCYLRELRTFQPAGPYYLGGYCFGGNVAYEMARQLKEQGEEVALLALLDSTPSNAGYERMKWWRPEFLPRFVVNIKYWLEDFAGIQPEEKKIFVQRKIRSFGRKVRRLFGKKSSRRQVDLEQVINPGHFPEHELKLWQAHLNALVSHVQRPYDGDVLLLRTRGQTLLCSLEEDFCWSDLIGGRVEVHRVPGSHENIFLEPHVAELAHKLSDCLAQKTPGGATSQKKVAVSAAQTVAR